jgi:exopolysaccharide biosynthesis polyprenyl glycosylphosphotransferase
MFNRHYRLYARILLALDAAVTLPALFVAYHLRLYLVQFGPEEFSSQFNPILLPFSEYLFYLLVFLPAWFACLVLTQRYETLLRQPLSRQLGRVLSFVFLAGSIMGLVSYALKLEVSRPIFFAFFVFMLVALPANRILLYLLLCSRNLNEHNRVHILVVGTDERACKLGETLEASRKWGYHVIGYLRVDGGPVAVPPDRLLGRLEELPRLLEQDGLADEVIFSTPARELAAYEDVVLYCQEVGVRTRIAADVIPFAASNVSLEFLEQVPLISFSSVPEHSWPVVVKRVLDFTVAAVGLALLWPFMLLVAAAVKFSSPGPVFYRQVRCGLNGRRFLLTKFRTMIDGAEDKLWEIRHLNEMDGPVFKMRNDPRVTPLGRYLRKFSIDELPQLWNVIKGEMSIVGPRAPLPEEVENYSVSQRRRLSVKPGITCLWQVSGRNEINFQQWMEMDLQYIDNWSVWLDLRIMLKTIPAVFTGRGAR